MRNSHSLLLLAALFGCEGEPINRSTDSAAELLVNFEVNSAVAAAASKCPDYQSVSFRQIRNGREDALNDLAKGTVQLVLVNPDEEVSRNIAAECSNELPPIQAIWAWNGAEDCGLVMDTSFHAEQYAADYTATVMETLYESGYCK